MNKKLKFIIAGVAIVAGLASAVSCQDLSKDVDSLSKRVSTLESTVAALQSKIDAGAVITNVTSTANGVTVTLSNGNTFNITNGKDGATGATGAKGDKGDTGAAGTPGSVVTIGDNGNWFIDGVDTGLTSKGQDGAPGAAGEAGKDGVPADYYVPNPTTGCFDKYSWDAETGAYVATPTEISYLAPGALTAIYDPATGVLTLVGVEGAEGGVVVIGGGAGAEGVTEITFENLAWNYNFFEAIEKDAPAFGPNGEITFTAGTEVNNEAEFLLKVTPATAVIAKEDISIINTKGETYDKFVVKSVEKYDDVLTKATDFALWKVVLGLSKYDPESFTEEVWNETFNTHVAFAVKVGDAVTPYDLLFEHVNYASANALNSTILGVVNPAAEIDVDGLDITTYKNRVTAGVPDLRWRNYTKKYPTPTVDIKDAKADKDGYTVIDGDARNTAAFPYLTASVGKPIVITANADQYKAMYVTLDKAHANANDPSELNAWEGYEITGLNTLSENGYIAVTVKTQKAEGDIIGFRVYAVNWDGTLADPDGIAFYVVLGEDSADTWNEVKTVVKPAYNGDFGVTTSDFTAISTKALDKAASWALIPENLTDPTWNIAGFYKSDKKTALTYANPSWKDVAFIKTVPTDAGYTSYEDEAEYSATLAIYDANDFLLASVPVTFSKTVKGLTAPAGFAIKEGMLTADKSYYIYQASVNGAAANYAYKSAQKATEETAKKVAGTIGTAAEAAFLGNELGEVVPFNLADFYKFGTLTAAQQANFITTIAGAGRVIAYDATTDTETDWTAAGDYIALDGTATHYYKTPIYGEGVNLYYDVNGAQNPTANLPASIVDNKAHAVTVSYNFGQISAELDNNNVLTPNDDVVIPVESFKVYFCSNMGKATWGYDWDLWRTTNLTAAGDVLTGSGVTAAGQNWHAVAPTHNARLNYNTVAGILTYVAVDAWTPSKIDATNYALWSSDPFKVDAPIVINLASGTAPGEVEIASTTIFGKSEKTGAAYNQSLNNALTATDAMYIPADHAGVAANWNLAIGAFEKAGTNYSNVKLSNEDYFVAKYGTTYTSGAAIAPNSIGLDKVATAAEPSVKVSMTCTVTAFDAFANKVTFTVPVELVPAP